MDKPTFTTKPINNIRELRIGDVICRKGGDKSVFVVAIFADPGTLGYQPADHTGMVYADFADNPGDVLEFKLDDIEMVEDAGEYLTKYNEYIESLG